MKKKVSGSANVSEVETEGLVEEKKGTDQGAGKSKPLQDGIPNIESRNSDPYPNKRQVKSGDFGDNPLVNTISSDEKAMKRFRDEE